MFNSKFLHLLLALRDLVNWVRDFTSKSVGNWFESDKRLSLLGRIVSPSMVGITLRLNAMKLLCLKSNENKKNLRLTPLLFWGPFFKVNFLENYMSNEAQTKLTKLYNA